MIEVAHNRETGYSVEIVPGDVVADRWDLYGPAIMATAAHDMRALDAVQIMQNLRGGLYLALQVIGGDELCGLAVCSIEHLQTGRAMEILTLSGEQFDEWADVMLHAMQAAAKVHGCGHLYLTGRMGWKKRLRRLGFESVAVTMKRDV